MREAAAKHLCDVHYQIGKDENRDCRANVQQKRYCGCGNDWEAEACSAFDKGREEQCKCYGKVVQSRFIQGDNEMSN